MMIHKIFIKISFTISDCPLANTESPAWKCSCRVCIKPPNISMQHGIQVPEIFCVSVLFLGRNPLLYPTLLLSQITNLENKKPPREFSPNPKSAPPRDPNRIPVSHPSCKGRILATWCAANQEKPKPCIVAATNTPAPILSGKNSLIHTFGLAVVFCFFFWWLREKVMKKW